MHASQDRLGVLVAEVRPDAATLTLGYELAAASGSELAIVLTAYDRPFRGLVAEAGFDPDRLLHESAMDRRRSVREAVEAIDGHCRYLILQSTRPLLVGAIAEARRNRCAALVVPHRALRFRPYRAVAKRAGIRLVETPRERGPITSRSRSPRAIVPRTPAR